jgi:hypothetical protein
VKENPTQEQAVLQPSLSACPNCLRDLGSKPVGSKPLYACCPFCAVQLVPVLWQRILIVGLCLILSVAFPLSLGIRGILPLIFAGLLCEFPALVIAMILVSKTIQPKYARKPGYVMTLFQR